MSNGKLSKTVLISAIIITLFACSKPAVDSTAVDSTKAKEEQSKPKTIPTLVSFSPASGSGASQVFTAVYGSPAGGTDILSTQVMMNNTKSPVGSCYFGYDKNRDMFLLLDDAGKAWLPMGTPPGSGNVSNHQCTIEGRGSGVMVSGDQLTVTYSIKFKSEFAGPKTIWTNAYSVQSGLGSDWESKSAGGTLSWTVTNGN